MAFPVAPMHHVGGALYRCERDRHTLISAHESRVTLVILHTEACICFSRDSMELAKFRDAKRAAYAIHQSLINDLQGLRAGFFVGSVEIGEYPVLHTIL